MQVGFRRLGPVPALVAGCSRGPKDYERELDERGIVFTEEAFLERAEAGDAGVVKLFIQAGMDPNARDEKGTTALMLAAGSGHAEVVLLLLESGSRPNVEDREGRTALDFTSADPASGPFAVLVDAGAIYGSLGE